MERLLNRSAVDYLHCVGAYFARRVPGAPTRRAAFVAVALVADAITAYAIYMLVLHVNLIVKVRRTIGTYIKEG